MPRPAPIAYYITPHGFGHAVRSLDILRAVHELRPDLPVIIVTTLPRDVFADRATALHAQWRPAAFDVGLVQRDSVRGDLEATLDALALLKARREADLRREEAFLKSHGVRLVVADIPGLPLRAADAVGVPRVACGNFSWNWIYESYATTDPRWTPYAAMYREDYAHAQLLLRQPFHEPMDAFAHIEDLPVLARPGRNRRDEMASALGLDPHKTWVLLSFSRLDWDEAVLTRLERLEDFLFLSVPPLGWPGRRNLHTVDRTRFPFSDVLASSDVVLTKPGFGIVSEVVATGKPVVYALREQWPESAVLEEALRRHARAVPITLDALYRGDLAGALHAALIAPAPREVIAGGGDLMAARRLIEMYDGG